MSSDATGRTAEARTWAAKAHELVQADPHRARDLARRAVEVARAEGDPEGEAAACLALGWAQHTLGEAREARKTLHAGIKLATTHGDRHGCGLLRRHLAYQLAYQGEVRAARREIAAAMELLTGHERARSHVHLVDIERRANDDDPAVRAWVLDGAAAALRVLRRRGDRIWEARLLHNRGAFHLERGELARAEADQARASLLFGLAGAHAAASELALLRAHVSLLRGEIVSCLRELDAVEARLPPGTVSIGLADCRYLALRDARLLPEAAAAAEAAIDLYSRTGRADFASGVLLDLAAIRLIAGDTGAAERLATRAARSVAARGKPAAAALARVVRLRACITAGRAGRSSLRAGLEAARALDAAGWRTDALRARLVVARLALAAGSLRTAERELALASRLRARGTVTDRVELCHAEALLRCARGDAAGAERSLLRGLRMLEAHRSALGAIELRAAASGIGSELPELGLRIALDSQRAARVLAWAERLRANALRLPPVRPPADATLRGLQTELRRVAAQIRDAETNGTPVRGSTARQAELEARIRAHTRMSHGAGEAQLELPPLRDISEALGDRSLVEYVQSDSQLHALTLARGRLRLHELGPAQEVTSELDWHRFALARLASGRRTATERAAAHANARASAASLERALVEPLLGELGDSPLVVVPTGLLHALPWGELPSLQGRPVEVCPSLTVWLGLKRRARRAGPKSCLIAGPRLRHATAEVRELAAIHPGATVLHGKEATAKAALAALDGAALAHLACHGRFRGDSPLFSSLELADGPLNVYELQRLRRPPQTIVLSACDLAVSQLHPGDELLGLAAALLALGTRTIVASVVPVPDAASRRLMLAFHRNLKSGDSPARALSRAQAEAGAAGFVCLGLG